VRVGQTRAVCRVLVAAFLALCAAAPLTTSSPLAASSAAAQPAPDPLAELSQLEQRADEARIQANEAAERYTNAQSSFEDLGNKIAALEQKIAAGEARREELRGIAERRAIVAYKNQGTDRDAIFESRNPAESARTSILLERANEADNAAVAEMAAVNAQLAAQRDRLAEDSKDYNAYRQRLADERKVLEARVAEADLALRALQAKRAAEGLGAPVVDGLVCPVPGAAFSNDFGQPRRGHSHQGNDMFAPMGTPNLAVVGGNVTYGPGGSGGNGAYLEGDNGVTYIYYHLSEYVGGPRRVAQGEIIAKLGMTGNAGAPHTHFEIRPGGRTASPINPYVTLVKICQ
jgi:murein DD-endopeptidase MepM/ murein hydrolase activator NlpD